MLTLVGCQAKRLEAAPESAYPQRIVSLVPSVTELIDAVGASDRLVGVTLNDNYPLVVSGLPKVGDQTIDLERVLSLEPDLVVLDTGFNQNKQALERLGLRVLELRCERLNHVPDAMRTLGVALGCQEEAELEAERFTLALSKVEKLEIEQEVFVEIWGEPLMTVGADTLVDDIFQAVGIKNSYGDVDGYFQVDPEDMVSRQPGIILLPTKTKEGAGSKAFQLLQNVGKAPAVVSIDPDLLVRAGPRLLMGIEALQSSLAPYQTDH